MPPLAPDPKDTIAPQNGTADVEVAPDQGGHISEAAHQQLYGRA